LEALRAKTPAVRPAGDWAVQYALFARGGFSALLRERAEKEGVHLVALSEIAQVT